MSLKNKMNALADAIRDKAGVSGEMTIDQMTVRVNNLQIGAEAVPPVMQEKSVTPTKATQTVTPDAAYDGLSKVTVAAIPAAYQNVTGVTAAAADVLSGKKIVNAAGTLVTGTMTNNGEVLATLNASTTSYTVPAGYHSGRGKVQISTEQKSVTPTTFAQNVTPSLGKVLSKVTVAAIPAAYQNTGDATATADDIRSGKTAYAGGVKLTGTLDVQSSGSAGGALSFAYGAALPEAVVENQFFFVNKAPVSGIFFGDGNYDISAGLSLSALYDTQNYASIQALIEDGAPGMIQYLLQPNGAEPLELVTGNGILIRLPIGAWSAMQTDPITGENFGLDAYYGHDGQWVQVSTEVE